MTINHLDKWSARAFARLAEAGLHPLNGLTVSIAWRLLNPVPRNGAAPKGAAHHYGYVEKDFSTADLEDIRGEVSECLVALGMLGALGELIKPKREWNADEIKAVFRAARRGVRYGRRYASTFTDAELARENAIDIADARAALASVFGGIDRRLIAREAWKLRAKLEARRAFDKDRKARQARANYAKQRQFLRDVISVARGKGLGGLPSERGPLREKVRAWRRYVTA